MTLGAPVVDAAVRMLIMMSILAPINELAAEPPVKFVVSVHCVALLPVVLDTVVLAAIC